MKINNFDDLSPKIPPVKVYNTSRNVDTVNKIIGFIRQSRHSALVRVTAENNLWNVPARDALSEIGAQFDFVKNNMRYTSDGAVTELVKTPEQHIDDIHKRGQAYGDCDDFVALLGALLYSIGYDVKPVVMRSAWNTQAGNFNHIYLYAVIPQTKQLIPLDASQDRPMSWEPASVEKRVFNV